MAQKFKQKNKGQTVLSPSKGFTLVETLVAIAIFTMSILGLMSVMAQGISDTTYAKQKIIATYLAQEGIEYVRNMRDTEVFLQNSEEWGGFIANNSLVPYDIDSIDFPGFTRVISVTDSILAGGAEVSSTVTWGQSSGLHSVIFKEILFDWW
jgi:prepilin-type N-terminal cleavage/methylation domain-containing protein